MKYLVLILTLLIPSQLMAQHRLGSPVEVAWDYTLANVTAGAVTRFEVKLDAGPWVNTGLPPTAITYVYVLPAIGLTVGNHTAHVRACSLVECNLEPSPLATFTVIRAVPAPPTNLRVQPGTQLVSNERIFELIQSYTLVVRDEPIRENELIQLIQAYRGPIPPTYNNVMDHLDATLLLLGR